jgi:hypothetical protein
VLEEGEGSLSLLEHLKFRNRHTARRLGMGIP